MSFEGKDKDFDDQVTKLLKQKIQVAIAKGVNLEYVDELKDRIVKRTRLGYGVDENNNTERLKPLSTPYKKTRKDNRSKLSKNTSPARSNLTAKGWLLKSLTTVKIKMQNGTKYVIRIGDRRGLGLDGKPSKIGNRKLNEYLEKQGRTWLGFTKPQRNKIVREIKKLIVDFLK